MSDRFDSPWDVREQRSWSSYGPVGKAICIISGIICTVAFFTGSGDGQRGGFTFKALLRFSREHPYFVGFIGLCGAIALIQYWRSRRSMGGAGWSTSGVRSLAVKGQTSAPRSVSGAESDGHQLSGMGLAEVREGLRQLRARDPNFSRPVFEEFLCALYAAIQRARVRGCAELLPYLAPHLVPLIDGTSQRALSCVRIASVQFKRVALLAADKALIDVVVQASIQEVSAEGVRRTTYRVDRLKFVRALRARSRSADRARALGCPKCGRQFRALAGTICAHCQEDVGGGRFDWCLTHLIGEGRDLHGPTIEKVAPAQVAGSKSEIAPGAQERLDAIFRSDASQNWARLCERIRHIWSEVREALNNRSAEGVGGCVSAAQGESLRYWVELCLAHKCTRISAAARVQQIELIDAVSDPFYDAVTVRLFISGCEFALADDGRILSGSRIHPRDSSEYWTVIRRCPGQAPAVDSAHGQALAFPVQGDWVLARRESIEQFRG